MSVQCARGITSIIMEEFGGASLEGFTHAYISGRIDDARAFFPDTVDPSEAVVVEKSLELIRKDVGRSLLAAKNAAIIVNKSTNIVLDVGINDPVKGFRSITVGSMHSGAMGRSSVHLSQKRYNQKYQSDFGLAMKERGEEVWDAYWNSTHDREVFDAAYYDRIGDKESYSKLSHEARSIYEVIVESSENRRTDANSLGAGIERLFGRVMRQQHDTYYIRKAESRLEEMGYSGSGITRLQKVKRAFTKGSTSGDRRAWMNFVLEHLDKERTLPDNIKRIKDKFKQDKAIESWLSDLYNEFSNGYALAYSTRNPMDPMRQGVKLSRALEEERVLHFTADGEYKYMQAFGKGNLRDSVFEEIHHSSHRMGLMEKFGMDPKANIDAIIREVRKKLNPDSKEAKAFEKYVHGFERNLAGSDLYKEYAVISGATNSVISPLSATLGSFVRTFGHITKLGFSTLSSVTDIGTMSTDLYIQHGAKHPLLSFRDALLAPMRGMVDKDIKAFSEAGGIGIEIAQQAMIERISALESPSGFMSKSMNTFFKYNGLNLWTTSARRGMYAANANNLANVFRSPESIPSHLKKLLLDYGIKDSDIELIRNSDVFIRMGDSEFLDITLFKEIPLEFFDVDDSAASVMSKALELDPSGIKTRLQVDARNKLENKFRDYFIDRNDLSVPTPGAETAARVHRGHPRGSVQRELFELFYQFKQFPIFMTNTIMRRNVQGLGSKSARDILTNSNGEMQVMAYHLFMLTMFGGAALTLKDFFKGREPYIPGNASEFRKFFLASFLHGGAMGLYGDFILDDSDVENKILRLAGPSANDFLDLKDYTMSAYAELFTDENINMTEETFKFQEGKVPFGNIFYTKYLTDFLFMWRMHEHMSPGAMDRMNERLEQNRDGRGMMLPLPGGF